MLDTVRERIAARMAAARQFSGFSEVRDIDTDAGVARIVTSNVPAFQFWAEWDGTAWHFLALHGEH